MDGVGQQRKILLVVTGWIDWTEVELEHCATPSNWMLNKLTCEGDRRRRTRHVMRIAIEMRSRKR